MPTMYRGRLWTMRQYAGFGTADQTNQRFRALLDAGQTGLCGRLRPPHPDGLSTPITPWRRARWARSGSPSTPSTTCAGCSAGIPLDQVSHLDDDQLHRRHPLLLYQLVAEEQGVDPASLRGTMQNDILKEYVARGTYIYPPRPSMRLVTDLFAYCGRRAAARGTRSRSAGTTSGRRDRPPRRSWHSPSRTASPTSGRRSTQVSTSTTSLPASRSSWNGHNDLFEEIAKFRAARRLWARLMRERSGPSTRVLRDAVPHPDSGQHAHRPTAGEQRRPHDRSRRWPRCSAAPSRCTPILR